MNLDVLLNNDLAFVKTKIKHTALSSFHFYNANAPQNLSEKELIALDELSKNIAGVDSLFTNIPLEETINISTESI